MNHSSPATASSSSVESLSTNQSSTYGGARPAWHENNSAALGQYSEQALEDARLGYVSPYLPLPTTTARSAVPSPPTITLTQEPLLFSSESDSTSTQVAIENVREYAGLVPLAQQRQQYHFRSIFSSREFSQAQKKSLIVALNEHRVNTVGELRRIERLFATIGSSDLTQPMTSAWVHYVNSNSLLTELRGLTKNYPFSSECLDEGKRRVHQDPTSNRSWNYCWLVLAKIHTDNLISIYARAQAARPEMWGGRTPRPEAADQLAQAFVQEWSAGLEQLLRYWETAPIVR